MHFLETLLLAVGLAMDATAVSVALGAVQRKLFTWRRILLTALFFGGFQAFMPLLGWLGGEMVTCKVQDYGSHIAAVLLILIGGKMIFEHNPAEPPGFGLRQLTVLATATSIDALVVGVSLACLNRGSIWPEIAIIGIVTALLTIIGGWLGRVSGRLLGSRCNILGGVVLILIGLKVLFWD